MAHVELAFHLNCRKVRRPTRAVVLGVILVAATSSRPARGQEARPVPEADAVGLPLARCVPRQDLICYLEFDGLDSHAGAWTKSAAYKLLNDTKLGAHLEDLAIQSIELLQDSVPPERRIKGADVVDLLKQIARNGFVFAMSAKPDRETDHGVAPGNRPEFKHLLEAVGHLGRAAETGDASSAQKAGRTLHPLGARGVRWVEKGALVLTETKKADEVLAMLEGKRASASDHPLRVQLTEAKGEFPALAIGFLDMEALSPLPASAIQLGLDRAALRLPGSSAYQRATRGGAGASAGSPGPA